MQIIVFQKLAFIIVLFLGTSLFGSISAFTAKVLGSFPFSANEQGSLAPNPV